MGEQFLIGLDYGSESARGVLVSLDSGETVASRVCRYRHGVMGDSLPDGTRLPPLWSLQAPQDYLDCAEDILSGLGAGREIAGIGVDFTASTVLPARADATPLSLVHPQEPHAYAKLWKHAAAQRYAEALQPALGLYLDDCGGKLSANSLIAKAAELAAEAPEIWREADKFIEAGDWLVWRLTGTEARSFAFATFKALYSRDRGYPVAPVPGLTEKLSVPVPVGVSAGGLSQDWRRRTGVRGDAAVAVAVIDSHAALPAAGAVDPGALVGALGTSAVYLLLDRLDRPMPAGVEGAARDASLPGLRCLEAGQASFGDSLAWFVRSFPNGANAAESFERYNQASQEMTAGASGVVALDWLGGNRVPHGDASLSGVFLGQTLATTPQQLYRALMESMCFGARQIVEIFEAGGLPVERVLMTSGLSLQNPALMQIMADIFGRRIDVPVREHLTAVGAAIHGGVASGVFPTYADGAERIGAKSWRNYAPDARAKPAYDSLYRVYRAIGDNPQNRAAMRELVALKARGPGL